MIENEEFGALQRFVLEHVELMNKLLEQETRFRIDQTETTYGGQDPQHRNRLPPTPRQRSI